MTQQYVKKLINTNPLRYKNIKLEDAIDKFARYYYILGVKNVPLERIKTFDEWLKSEI